MADREEICHYRDQEFFYKNVHYGPGWYWYDEEGDLYGPFNSEHQALVGMQIYLQQLAAGVAPTQVANVPLLGKKS